MCFGSAESCKPEERINLLEIIHYLSKRSSLPPTQKEHLPMGSCCPKPNQIEFYALSSLLVLNPQGPLIVYTFRSSDSVQSARPFPSGTKKFFLSCHIPPILFPVHPVQCPPVPLTKFFFAHLSRIAI